MSDRAITFLRTLLDRDSDEGVALYEDFEDEARAALTELEANAYITPLRNLEPALLRCLSVAYGGISPHQQSRRRDLARRMFEAFHEETGLTKTAMLAHIDKVNVNWRFQGREDMRAGISESTVAE